MTSRLTLVLLALILVTACGGRDGRTGTRDAAPGPSDASASDANGPSDAAPGPDAQSSCFGGSLVVDVSLDVRIEEMCAIWNSLDLLAGMATITWDGTVLTIDFGDGVVFSGTLVGDSVMLTYVHPHDFVDGCGWQATETLFGLVNADCSLSLAYDYAEMVIMNNGGCATPCAAMADVQLELTPII